MLCGELLFTLSQPHSAMSGGTGGQSRAPSSIRRQVKMIDRMLDVIMILYMFLIRMGKSSLEL